MEQDAPTPPPTGGPAGLSPPASRLADWLRDLARTAKTARLYRTSNAALEEARSNFASATNACLDELGEFTVRVTPEEILYEDEALVHPAGRGPARGEAAQRLLSELPLVLYRDGLRELTILPGIPPHDINALVDAIGQAWSDRLRADDLVTALWQANPTHLRVESAPPEQMLYVASGAGQADPCDRGFGLGFGLPPLAGELHGDLGDRGGRVGLQRERGLEEPPVAIYISPRRGYESLASELGPARERLLLAWNKERAEDWRDEAARLFERLLAADTSPAAGETLARFAATGVGHAIDHARWTEAIDLLALARRVDPGGAGMDELLASMITARSDRELGEALDEATAQELDAFFRLAISLGPAGIGLALGALSGAARARTRAAASAAITFLCADDPSPLTAAVCDRSWELVATVVSILGQIGGRAIAPLCAQAAHHPDPRVTREVARIVPALPEPERTELVLNLLATRDTPTLLLALRSSSREHNPKVADHLVALITAAAFDERPEEERRTMFQSLAETGDDRVVPFLEGQLTAGGWFARPSWRRTAAAHALDRLGTADAHAALSRARAHSSEAVRAACRDLRRTEAA